ncbi:MAG: 6-phosphogluconolactonase [Candidatus Bipolaricaulota bacterium]
MRNAIVLPGPPQVAEEASRLFVDCARRAIAARGRFIVALAGGRTPLEAYRRIAASPIDWQATHILLTDERCVPADSPQSNFGAIRRALLDEVPIPRQNVHRFLGELDPVDAADRAEQDLRCLLGAGERLDLCFLGVGTDGHTASLFPRQQALREERRFVLPVHAPAEPEWRVTLTIPRLDATESVVFLVVGAEKASVVRRLRDGEDLPASRVRPAGGDPIWLLDREADGATTSARPTLP